MVWVGDVLPARQPLGTQCIPLGTQCTQSSLELFGS